MELSLSLSDITYLSELTPLPSCLILRNASGGVNPYLNTPGLNGSGRCVAPATKNNPTTFSVIGLL